MRPCEPTRNDDVLVKGLLGVDDVRADGKLPGHVTHAVHEHVTQVLSRVGVERLIVMSGDVFDPSAYEALFTQTTDDPGKLDRVIETIRPGWQRPGLAIRATPQVAVWLKGNGSHPTAGALS